MKCSRREVYLPVRVPKPQSTPPYYAFFREYVIYARI
jgi:hypothetical protein